MDSSDYMKDHGLLLLIPSHSFVFSVPRGDPLFPHVWSHLILVNNLKGHKKINHTKLHHTQARLNKSSLAVGVYLLFVALIQYGFSSGCYSTCSRLHNFLNRMPVSIICIPSPGQTKTPWVYYLLFLSDRQCNTSVQTKHQRQNTMCTNPLR